MERLFEQFKMYLLTERRVSNNTLQSYSTDLRQFLDYVHVHCGSETVTLADLKKFLVMLKDMKMSARSMGRKVSTLKSFFNYLARYHNYENCAHALVIPKIENKLPRVLSQDDVGALLNVAEKDVTLTGWRNRIMLTLLYVTGMRISELTNIKVSDIKYDDGLIIVSGKGGKERLIPITKILLENIKAYSLEMEAFAASKGFVTQPHYLFSVLYASGFKSMTRQACWGIVKKIWSLTGIQKTISPHMLRHSLATHMLANGADLRSLQMILGHENLSTVQVYTHVDTTYLRTVYDSKHPRS